MADQKATPAPLPKSVPAPDTDTITPSTAFKGYTLADIRYYRALTALQREFCSQKIASEIHRLQASNPLTGGRVAGKNHTSRLGPLAQRIFSGFNYVDYALIGLQTFSTVKKIFSFFRKKRH